MENEEDDDSNIMIPPNAEDIPKNEYVDRVTLELLMNKPQYNRYLESTNPEVFKKKRSLNNELQKYQHIIIDIVKDEISNYNNKDEGKRSNQITRSFDNFIKSCIDYIKSKELETENPFNKREPDEIFENCDPIEEKIKDNHMKDLHYFSESSDDDNQIDRNTPVNTLWGKGAIKSTTSYDIKMFASRKKR